MVMRNLRGNVLIVIIIIMLQCNKNKLLIKVDATTGFDFHINKRLIKVDATAGFDFHIKYGLILELLLVTANICLSLSLL